MAVINIVLYFVVVLVGLSIQAVSGLALARGLGRSKVCQSYISNSSCTEFQPKCFDEVECEKHETHLCAAYWSFDYAKNRPILLWKGCMPATHYNPREPSCFSVRGTNPPRYSCYCNGDLCNESLIWHEVRPHSSTTTPEPPADIVSVTPSRCAIMITLLLIVLLTGYVVIAILSRRHRRNHESKNQQKIRNILQASPRPPPLSPKVDLHVVKKIDIVASGNYGTIWRGQLISDTVAIKIIKTEGKESWQNELNIFKTPQMRHPNILNFIGSDERVFESFTEYWLVTDYHSKGSLYDYLKNNVINWSELCKISESMVRGLKHLHSELPATMSCGYKPAIAHRDFKSKNVLIKSDLTACIADFGLAHAFVPGQNCGNRQVGTRRYMAPEFLEGSINFSQDSFLRIDMYACALVLWELLSRSSVSNEPVGEYMLPFEKELGPCPNIASIKDLIVYQKKRPEIPKSWRANSLLLPFCDTIEECWDDDADARPSAFCVAERITELRQLPKYSPPADSIDPPPYSSIYS